MNTPQKTLHLVALLLLMAAPIYARYQQPDLEQVPIDRLIKNLSARVDGKTTKVADLYVLGRVYSEAWALGTNQISVLKKSGDPFLGYGTSSTTPPHVSRNTSDAVATAPKEYLEKAIFWYSRAVQTDTNHFPSQLGLAWCLEQNGQKKEALAGYRTALELAWKLESKARSTSERSQTEEVAGYLKPLLDPKKDKAEISELESRVAVVSKLPRRVTPILIPTTAETALDKLVNPMAKVAFDLDGSGLERRWGWITPKAAWLVYDPRHEGRIKSGLQLFGGVTFWIFWENGYQALSALDDDNNGVLSGDELAGLALWQDENGNGVSDPGEVRPLASWGIVALRCRYETHPTGIPFSPRGVEYRDGTVRPSYDWFAPRH